ncbi:SDR family NAD(P)-dependent oxidoreductase [bacterium]|nr:SDR family NAD(P)-dependent oxidoreductase [bacterium]
MCLITDEGSLLTDAIANKLRQQGWGTIVILRFPDDIVHSEKNRLADFEVVQTKDLSEESIQQSLNQIQENHGTIGSFVHIHPASSTKLQLQNLFPEKEKNIIKTVFFLAKHLNPSLERSAETGRSCFFVITRLNGMLGFGASRHNNGAAGGLYGLLKTANIEWNNVFCRAIDLTPDSKVEEAADFIKNELYDADLRITEVGYSKEGRMTLSTEIQNGELEVANGSDVDSQSVFLVAGGAKGVTAACVVELAKRHRCRFILLGRTEYPVDEPSWLNGITNEKELKKLCMEEFIKNGEKPTPVKIMNFLRPILAQREIKATITAITAESAKVDYISANIFDQKSLSEKLKPVIKAMGPITGIIHGAGVLADKLIKEKTFADYDAVVSTKIDGLQSLIHCIAPEQLKHLILFSSAAGFYGNEAQSDYALANEILNKFAHQFKALYPACHVVSFNWGPWDGGMVTPELKRLFEQRNVKVIPIDIGAKIMANELSSDQIGISQVVIGNSMVIPKSLDESLLTSTVTRSIGLNQNPFLSSHIIGKEPVMPIITALSWMADTCEQLYPGYHFIASDNTGVLKGIVFKDARPDNYAVQIKETEKRDSGELILDVNISSLSPENKQVFHYRSLIHLSPFQLESSVLQDFKLADTEPKQGAEFYRDGTLFHGPSFQTVSRQLNIDRKRLTLLCEAPGIKSQESGQFQPNPFNFFADDTQLQALLIWVRHYYQSASLPLKIAKGEFYKKIPFNTPFYITVQVESTTDTKLVANTFAHDKYGHLYSKLIGAEAIISKALDGKFLRQST